MTSLALGGIAMLAALSNQPLKQVFIDTNICHPTLMRTAVDLLGADNVLAGSDWPINDGPIGRRRTEAMQSAGFSAAEQEAIAGGNARRLLGLA